MKPGLLEQIKERGYWRINFEPLVYAQNFNTLGECRESVEKNSVSLRGWDYPHIPRRTETDIGMAPGNNFYEGWTDWGSFKEYWRMYQSGQFLHFMAIHEDWLEFDEMRRLVAGGRAQDQPPVKPMEVLNLIGGVVYQLTEVFQFLSRLTSSGLYEEGVRISISVHKTTGRRLWPGDVMRHLFEEYKCHIDEIAFEKIFSRDEILTKPKECALEAILYVVTRFGWDNPAIDVINQDQENLIHRRF